MAEREQLIERLREWAGLIETQYNPSDPPPKEAREQVHRLNLAADTLERDAAVLEGRNEKTGLTQIEDEFLGRFTDAMMGEKAIVAILDSFAFDGRGYSVKLANEMREALTAGFTVALAALQHAQEQVGGENG